MKKFNEFEKGMLLNALDFYVAHLEAEIEKMQKEVEGSGYRSIVAPGFYKMMMKDLKVKVETLTKKSK